jgi:TPR repeat protein
MYAVGYFLEVGIGTPPDPKEYVFITALSELMHMVSRSTSYYKKSAELGDKRAQQRLKGSPAPGRAETVVLRADGSDGKNAASKDCVIM